MTNAWHSFMDELWVPVKGYEGRYSISNRGRVYSHDHCKSRFLKHRLMKTGHQKVQLRKNYVKYTPCVSTLVGRHFLPDYREGLVICHRDETLPLPERDYVENLFVGTQKENMIDCVKKGRHWKGYGVE